MAGKWRWAGVWLGLVLLFIPAAAAAAAAGGEGYLENVGPGSLTALYEFKITAEEMLLQPEHIFNGSGTLSVRPDVRRLGFASCFSPPYLANPLEGVWRCDNRPIEVEDYIWYPSETVTLGRLADDVVVQQLIPLTGGRRFICRLILYAGSPHYSCKELTLAISGNVGRMDLWGWVPPYAGDGSAKTSAADNLLVLTKGETSLIVAAKPAPRCIETSGPSLTFAVDVVPGMIQEITVVVDLGETLRPVSEVFTVLDKAGEHITDSRDAWNKRIELIRQRLPRLITSDEKLQRFYQRCILTFLTTRWEAIDAVFSPWYAESGIDGGAMNNYLWGDAYISKFLTLADPAATRQLLLTSMQADYSNHYAINFLRGEGMGVSYSYDYFSMAQLTYDYIVLTGDAGLLNEKIRGQNYLDALYAFVFAREDMSRPPVLIDYGENKNLLELRRTKAYQHYTPSPNLERMLSYRMMDEMYQWRGRPAPVDFKRRAEQFHQILMEQLWNEPLQWFHALDENQKPQVCYSLQIFDMLRTGALSPEQARGLVGHLNEQEFLSQWGVHSMSKKDTGYDGDDVDWGGPGVYAGDAPELVMDLLQAGFADEGVDVLRRILWWGDFPYIPQAVRADARDYRRDGRANIIAALAGPQAVVWGLMGITVDGHEIRINPVGHPYVAGMKMENLCIRGMDLTICVDADGAGFSVKTENQTLHHRTGQTCRIPLAPLAGGDS